jgi:WD40 repeat-containing protein SMU1
MILEWAEEGFVDAARELLRRSDPMDILRSEEPERYIHLEGILSRTAPSKKQNFVEDWLPSLDKL